MALKVNLRSGDRLWMGTSNIEVIAEGYTTLIINGDIPVLRDSDAIFPGPNATPAQRFRYAVQQSYLSNDSRYLDEAEQMTSYLGMNAQRAANCIALFRANQKFKALREAIAIDRAV